MEVFCGPLQSKKNQKSKPRVSLGCQSQSRIKTRAKVQASMVATKIYLEKEMLQVHKI